MSWLITNKTLKTLQFSHYKWVNGNINIKHTQKNLTEMTKAQQNKKKIQLYTENIQIKVNSKY